jgi:hypothetical protein
MISIESIEMEYVDPKMDGLETFSQNGFWGGV